MINRAQISGCGRYRYSLTRRWDDPASGCLGFCMLNPSTADANEDDPTIRRCMGFARSFGFGGILVFNLFGLRATDPTDLRAALDPIGPANERHVRYCAGSLRAIVCAWGSSVPPEFHDYAREFPLRLREWSGGARICHLGLTKGGWPKHPLYLAGSTPLQDFFKLCHAE